MSISKYLVLLSLTPKYPLAAKQIAIKLGASSSTVRKQLCSMKKEGLVSDDAPKDPFFTREKRWRLTDRGIKERRQRDI